MTTKKIDKVEEVVPEVAAEETTQTIPAEKLSLADLNTMRQIIEICGSRGAIRANEMTTVGALHTKLHAFLVEAGIIKPAAPAAQTDTGDAPATADDAAK